MVGSGDPAKLKGDDWLKIGGAALSKIGTAKNVTVVLALPGAEISAENAAEFALGMLLRSYTFDKYKTKKGKDDEREGR